MDFTDNNNNSNGENIQNKHIKDIKKKDDVEELHKNESIYKNNGNLPNINNEERLYFDNQKENSNEKLMRILKNKDYFNQINNMFENFRNDISENKAEFLYSNLRSNLTSLNTNGDMNNLDIKKYLPVDVQSSLNANIKNIFTEETEKVKNNVVNIHQEKNKGELKNIDLSDYNQDSTVCRERINPPKSKIEFDNNLSIHNTAQNQNLSQRQSYNQSLVKTCYICKFNKENIVNMNKSFLEFLSRKLNGLIEYIKDPNYQLNNSNNNKILLRNNEFLNKLRKISLLEINEKSTNIKGRDVRNILFDENIYICTDCIDLYIFKPDGIRCLYDDLNIKLDFIFDKEFVKNTNESVHNSQNKNRKETFKSESNMKNKNENIELEENRITILNNGQYISNTNFISTNAANNYTNNKNIGDIPPFKDKNKYNDENLKNNLLSDSIKNPIKEEKEHNKSNSTQKKIEMIQNTLNPQLNVNSNSLLNNSYVENPKKHVKKEKNLINLLLDPHEDKDKVKDKENTSSYNSVSANNMKNAINSNEMNKSKSLKNYPKNADDLNDLNIKNFSVEYDNLNLSNPINNSHNNIFRKIEIKSQNPNDQIIKNEILGNPTLHSNLITMEFPKNNMINVRTNNMHLNNLVTLNNTFNSNQNLNQQNTIENPIIPSPSHISNQNLINNHFNNLSPKISHINLVNPLNNMQQVNIKNLNSQINNNNNLKIMSNMNQLNQLNQLNNPLAQINQINPLCTNSLNLNHLGNIQGINGINNIPLNNLNPLNFNFILENQNNLNPGLNQFNSLSGLGGLNSFNGINNLPFINSGMLSTQNINNHQAQNLSFSNLNLLNQQNNKNQYQQKEEKEKALLNNVELQDNNNLISNQYQNQVMLNQQNNNNLNTSQIMNNQNIMSMNASEQNSLNNSINFGATNQNPNITKTNQAQENNINQQNKINIGLQNNTNSNPNNEQNSNNSNNQSNTQSNTNNANNNKFGYMLDDVKNQSKTITEFIKSQNKIIKDLFENVDSFIFKYYSNNKKSESLIVNLIKNVQTLYSYCPNSQIAVDINSKLSVYNRLVNFTGIIISFLLKYLEDSRKLNETLETSIYNGTFGKADNSELMNNFDIFTNKNPGLSMTESLLNGNLNLRNRVSPSILMNMNMSPLLGVSQQTSNQALQNLSNGAFSSNSQNAIHGGLSGFNNLNLNSYALNNNMNSIPGINGLNTMNALGGINTNLQQQFNCLNTPISQNAQNSLGLQAGNFLNLNGTGINMMNMNYQNVIPQINQNQMNLFDNNEFK